MSQQWTMYPYSEEAKALLEALAIVDTLPNHDRKSQIRNQLEKVEAVQRSRARKLDYDRRNRILVGSMVSMAQHDNYALAAQRTGRSLNRFVVDALEAERARCLGLGR